MRDGSGQVKVPQDEDDNDDHDELWFTKEKV